MHTDTDTFPFRRSLSLHKLIDAWRGVAASEQNPARRALAEDLIARAEVLPVLADGSLDSAVLADNDELVNELMQLVVPAVRAPDSMIGGLTPFMMKAFFMTPAFLDLFTKAMSDEEGAFSGLGSPTEVERTKALDAYHIILKELYGVNTGFVFPSVLGVKSNGLTTYYRIHVDPRFIDLDVIGEKPELSDDDISRLTRNPLDFELWNSLLPPDRFLFRGFTLLSLLEVTEHEVHSRLKNDLLQKNALTTPAQIDSIGEHLRDLLKIPDLRVGIIGVPSGRFEDIADSKTFGKSLLLDDSGIPHCTMKDQSSYAKLFETGEPVVITDLEECSFCTGFEYRIKEQEQRGLLLAPLKDGDRIMGVLELATREAGRLTSFSVFQLMDVIALFSAAMLRGLDERHDRIQARIKKEFTSIHPSVEWKFRRAAEKLDRLETTGAKAESEDIVFDDVYPLYGLSDIRDSSVRRNRAIQNDLVEQLGSALAVVVEGSSHRPLPALDEIGFRLARYAQSVETGLTSDAEVGALEFLRNDVEPLFERLAGVHPRVREKVDAYKALLDERLGVLYKRRREYEEAVALVNETVSDFLQRQQIEAQSMYPHYFEKYETDGVDYNIYVGGALSEDIPFDPLYLRNLRLWQLLTMCGVVWELNKAHEGLPVPLEVAHLVLVQDFPIAIRFSKDEKRFGVDGAYNARYMIVKKRIDKALVNGTTERITQPGKIAIVYSQEKERREYVRYLEYLAASGYTVGPPEDLEVEPLQGVNGLRVLRVTVSEFPPEMEVRTRPELAANLVAPVKTPKDDDNSGRVAES